MTSSKHPERDAAPSARVFARIARPLLILALIAVAVPVYGDVMGLWSIPQLETFR